MSQSLAGHIGRPETVREAVVGALRDFARAYKRTADDVLASVDLYERVVRDYLPEAVASGADRALEEERFFPAPAVLRKHVAEAHERIVRSRSAIVPDNRDPERRCLVCGAEAQSSESGKRSVINHDPRAHGIYLRPTLA